MPDYTIRLEGKSTPELIPGTGISFAAPGLTGELTVDAKPAPTQASALTRSSLRDSGVVASSDSVDEAIQEISSLDSFNLETEARTPEVKRSEGVRAGVGGLADDEAVVDYEAKPDEYSFVIYRDEAGGISIHFPEGLGQPAMAEGGSTAAVRAAPVGIQHYRIPLRSPAPLPAAPPTGPTTRFGVATIGKKLIKLVIGKIIKKTAGPFVEAADFGAIWLWENRARAFQGFHGGKSAEDLLADNPAPLTASNWSALQGDGKKALLFIHGTTSTTSGAFGGLHGFSNARNMLYEVYGDRVIGFNHHTLTLSVADNVADFYSGLPANGTFDFDIVCHSRGGLVARALKELTVAQIRALTGKTFPTSGRVKIGKIIFVGTPNIGTQLADPKGIPHALDLLSNVASLIPGAGLTLAGIFSCAAFVAENGFKVLPGMRNMDPSDSFLSELNHPAAGGPSPLGDYYAVQSNFSSASLVNKVLLEAVKYLFKGNLNDLIVPTLGSSNIDGTALGSDSVSYFGAPPKVENVAHTQYFQQKETWDFIADKLK
jgi:hypothetical protein